MTNKSAKFEILSLFVFFFTLACEGIFIKTDRIKVDVLQDQKIYCLKAWPCIFQPGNFTGLGSEGVKIGFQKETDGQFAARGSLQYYEQIKKKSETEWLLAF